MLTKAKIYLTHQTEALTDGIIQLAKPAPLMELVGLALTEVPNSLAPTITKINDQMTKIEPLVMSEGR